MQSLYADSVEVALSLAYGDDSVSIPIRIVATVNESITKGVIEATNSQTEVTDEQLKSLSDFQKTLEEHFATYEGDSRLFYERRSKQCELD